MNEAFDQANPSKQGGASFADLRDRIKAQVEVLSGADQLDVATIRPYLLSLETAEHTADSIDALIHLARYFYFQSDPFEALRIASHATRLATALHLDSPLCAARGTEGIALTDLGRFAEATIAQGESLTLARMVGDTRREVFAVSNLGYLCGGMGQWSVSLHYHELARTLADAGGFSALEQQARGNMADCALQLRDPHLGLRALSHLAPAAPNDRLATHVLASIQNTLARLHLLLGDVTAARVSIELAARHAQIAGVEKTSRFTSAVAGLIDVMSGTPELGLAAVDSGLAFAKQRNQSELADHLGLCIDAYEAAGNPDKALEYLHELVAWKRKSIEAVFAPLQQHGLSDSVQLQTGSALFDDRLADRAHALESDVLALLQRLMETAINAELMAGHDLYRTFRVANLSRLLAASKGWDEARTATLARGAQLRNIGMMAVPARILQKEGALSKQERQVLRDYPRYGAELLRKSQLRTLDVASVIAEQHRERFDGSGYPRGLAGVTIAEEARIVAICDRFDAMTHQRPWRAAHSIQAALNEIENEAGKAFDPEIAATFIATVRREFWKHEDWEKYLAAGADEVAYVRARARMDGLLGTNVGLVRPTDPSTRAAPA